MLPTFLLFLFFSLHVSVHAFSSYANDFVDPDYILSGNYPNATWQAQVTIVEWANDAAASGPWSVVNKSFAAPSGDIHDYMSWAPYWWPNCTGIGNTTELSENQIWKICPYYSRDGLFNPDVRLVNDVGAFQNLSDAVLYNAITWAFRKEPSNIYSRRVAQYLQTWFLNPATKMNPNLNYGQMQRGPDGQIGSHTGILDLKGFVKIATGILILRKGKSPDWTPDMDGGMNAWCAEYITWLETNEIALEEGWAKNNHGTFYYNQLAALKLIVGDLSGAFNVTQTYFNAQFKTQISANGEQPLEAVRTRPYHYHAYNLAAMITNARLQLYASPSNPNPFYFTTQNGSTIQTALDFALSLDPAASNEEGYADEMNPNVAAVGAEYGDPEGMYANFLDSRAADVDAGEPTSGYAGEAYFLWDQPLGGGTPGNFQDNDPDPNQVGINTNSPTANNNNNSPGSSTRAGSSGGGSNGAVGLQGGCLGGQGLVDRMIATVVMGMGIDFVLSFLWSM